MGMGMGMVVGKGMEDSWMPLEMEGVVYKSSEQQRGYGRAGMGQGQGQGQGRGQRRDVRSSVFDQKSSPQSLVQALPSSMQSPPPPAPPTRHEAPELPVPVQSSQSEVTAASDSPKEVKGSVEPAAPGVEKSSPIEEVGDVSELDMGLVSSLPVMEPNPILGLASTTEMISPTSILKPEEIPLPPSPDFTENGNEIKGVFAPPVRTEVPPNNSFAGLQPSVPRLVEKRSASEPRLEQGRSRKTLFDLNEDEEDEEEDEEDQDQDEIENKRGKGKYSADDGGQILRRRSRSTIEKDLSPRLQDIGAFTSMKLSYTQQQQAPSTPTKRASIIRDSNGHPTDASPPPRSMSTPPTEKHVLTEAAYYAQLVAEGLAPPIIRSSSAGPEKNGRRHAAGGPPMARSGRFGDGNGGAGGGAGLARRGSKFRQSIHGVADVSVWVEFPQTNYR